MFAGEQRPREHIDVATWTPGQEAECWPDLRNIIYDPCTSILFNSLHQMKNDPEARAELRVKRKAIAEQEQASLSEHNR